MGQSDPVPRRCALEPRDRQRKDRARDLPPAARHPRPEPRRRLSRLPGVRAGRGFHDPAEPREAALRFPDRRGVPRVSLLLEALKKAELAKQNASGQQGESTAAPAEAPGGLALEGTPTEPGERPLITRDRLPDITQPLEILSEDLPSAGTRREAPPAATATPSIAPMAAAPSSTPAATEDVDRASAR